MPIATSGTRAKEAVPGWAVASGDLVGATADARGEMLIFEQGDGPVAPRCAGL